MNVTEFLKLIPFEESEAYSVPCTHPDCGANIADDCANRTKAGRYRATQHPHPERIAAALRRAMKPVSN